MISLRSPRQTWSVFSRIGTMEKGKTMFKTFFEKVPVKDGDVLINYTSSVKDATLERLYRYSISRFDTSVIVAEQEGFKTLADARHAAWSNLGKMIKLFSSRPVNGIDEKVITGISSSDYHQTYGTNTPPPKPSNIKPKKPPKGYVEKCGKKSSAPTPNVESPMPLWVHKVMKHLKDNPRGPKKRPNP